MSIVHEDRKIAEVLAEKINLAKDKFEYDDNDRLIGLNLTGCSLLELPYEIWQLVDLQKLDLSENQLRLLPAEIGQLANLQTLILSDNQLSRLPSEIGQLTNLQALYLSGNKLIHLPVQLWNLVRLQELRLDDNQLKQIPIEIGLLTGLKKVRLSDFQGFIPDALWKLTNLQELYLQKGQLTQLPVELWSLTGLQILNLRENQLRKWPTEIGLLTSLQEFNLDKNQLQEVPDEIGQLSQLQKLWLDENQLQEVPAEIGQLSQLQELYLQKNQLSYLPDELWTLTSLQELYLWENQLQKVPPQIGQLNHLQKLYLWKNQLSEVPAELWSLTSLQELNLGGNQLRDLPPQIGQLSNLQKLYLQKNQLNQLPAELWALSNLQILNLGANQLTQLSAAIEQLSNLQELYLGKNELSLLPPEAGHLTNLQILNVDDMPTLLTPPPEIVTRGTKDMLAFLRELQKSSTLRKEAKLLTVGEGGTGKSSLSRALRNERFNPTLSTTHGIEVGHLNLLDSGITLNIWDFGGQQIYHSTHQFFFTKRSLYLVVWNARLGAEQGRLHYWLDTIKSLAPDARIILVATHVDERGPDLNYQLYRALCPQLVSSLSVSNKQGTGLIELEKLLLKEASQLPLMGQPWPLSWMAVEKTLLSRLEHYIDANEYSHCCATCGVEADIASGTLGNYLHDLGKILYFRDDYILSNLVILKPNWVTKAISRVLDDEAISKTKGILHHSELSRIWATDDDGQAYESYLYPAFLRLMEKFDLSYQIEADMPGENATSSLIPLLLPHEPPENLPQWPKKPPMGQSQVEMVYRLDSVPAGIMSRFIVRTHRYTKNLHWRDGAMLEYQGHQARAELNPMLRELHLIVQGTLPQNFFAILMHTIDAILARFEGLTINREIPCTCHWEHESEEPCPRYYRYEDLVRRMQAHKHIIECPDTFTDIYVPLLLYGIHSSTNEQVMKDIQQGQQEIKHEIKQGQQEIKH